MSLNTSIAGAVGFAHQSAINAANTSYFYMPATSVNIEPQQNAQTLPAEIGGDYFLRGSYKASIMGTGSVGFVVRPQALGHLLLMLTGVDTVTNPSSGVYVHTYTPFAVGSGNDLPWYTMVKAVSSLYAEQYLNTRLSSLQLTIPKSAIATGQASFNSTSVSQVTAGSLGSKTFDTAPQFQSCLASVSFTPEGGGSNISVNAIKSERFGLTYNNNLTNDEFSVGNYGLDDITLLQRTVTADMDFVVRDTALHDAVYYNASSAPSAWSPTIFRGTLSVTLTSSANIPGTSTPYSCVFNFAGLDFLTMPVPMQGADLVRASLSTQVTLGPSGSDRFSVVLTNGTASY